MKRANWAVIFASSGWLLLAIHLGSSQPTQAKVGDGGGVAGGCPGDTNGDNVVNVDDLLIVIGSWGTCGCQIDEHCNDNNPCTTDTCIGGACHNEPVPGCCLSAADCSPPNATAVCMNNQCVISACAGGFYDCNGLVSDGCESTVPCCAVVKINEVGANQYDFIELRNNCSTPVNLAGWKLVYRTASGTTDIPLVDLIGVIQPFGYRLSDGFSQPFLSTGGGVALRDPGGNIVDSMGWGNATNAFVETAPAQNGMANVSMARPIDGNDSNNNAFDFVVDNTPTPGSSNMS